MIEVEVAGLEQLEANVVAALQAIGVTGQDLVVRWKAGGPSAPYAVYVHEDLRAHHAVGGAKFFSRVLLEQSESIPRDIAALVMSGTPLSAAARTVAELVLTQMKEATPVRYGALKGSEHVEVTRG